MTTASHALAAFAAGLAFEEIPAAVLDRAKASLIDTVAAAVFGSELPWSRIILDYVERNSAPGKALVLGTRLRVCPPHAAFANGAFAHAFEMDSLCHPSVGVHPGASLTAPGLAVAQACGASGKDLLAAFVAGCEVMYRIGDAGRHSSEKLGFHAPGLTGVFGGAVVAGRLMGLDAGRMANALGIAGSLCSGLLEFSRSGGGMVKRLHLGRAAEGGVMAAMLARDGFTGPAAVLEGKFGFLNAFCRDRDPQRLTAALGSEWHTLKIMLKRYACHITAHVPVTAVLEMKAQDGIAADEVASITVAGSEKMVSHHNIPEPQDLAMAQYSTPFCVALALHRDPLDPRSFCEQNLNDPAIRATARKVAVELRPSAPDDHAFVTRLTVRLRDGRELTREARDFPGMPHRPLAGAELRAKFMALAASLGAAPAQRLFEKLENLETLADVADLIAADE
jgi:2-methylcitrate dehydratase PrpD